MSKRSLFPKIYWVSLFSFLFVGLIACSGQESHDQVASPYSNVQITMTLDAKDWLEFDTVKIDFAKGMTLRQAVNEASEFNFNLKTYEGMGELVTGIKGLINNQYDGHYWQYCINGTYADAGINDVILQGGETIAWYYRAYGESPCKKIGEK